MNRQALSKYIDSIDHSVSKDLGRISNSLHLGLSGLALYYFELSAYFDKKAFRKKGLNIVHRIFLNLERGDRFNVPDLFSFSSGLSGVLFAIGHALKNGHLGKDDVVVDPDIERELFTACMDNMRACKTDPLHGALGILYYFSSLSVNDTIDGYLHKILEEYRSVLKIDAYGCRVKNVQLLDQVDDEFNLSLSHGLCGHLYILGNIRSEKCKSIVNETIKLELDYLFLNENDNKTEQESLFPSVVVESSEDPKDWERQYDVRLGWCYGDLNQSAALLQLGRRFNDAGLIRKAISIARNTLHKTGLEAAKIKTGDPFFCHGTIGLAYQYHVLHLHSHLAEFRTASEYWAKKTFEQLGILDTEQLDRENYSLLEGLPGVVAMLLAIENNCRVSFDHIFFL